MQSSSVGTDTGAIRSNGWFENLERFLSHKMIFRLFPISVESKSCFSFILSVSDSQQISK